MYSVIVPLGLALAVSAVPMVELRAEFTLANGQAAQALNAKFATFTADTPCNAGDVGCVNGQFGQCLNGKFALTPCAGGLTCLALPLVNKPGTSVTCDTEADATTRIQTTGASGGLKGRSEPELESRAEFTLANGQAAQALNAKFATFTADTPCNAGDVGCVNGQFGQCLNGKFALTPCAGGLTCLALPLVNKPGTSVTCDTEADATTRIGTTGAAGGLKGRSEPELERRAAFTLANGKAAQALNKKFASNNANTSCKDGEVGCVGTQFGKCLNGKFVLSPCAGGLTCIALPLVNSPGTSVTCDTAADAATRIAATGAKGGIKG